MTWIIARLGAALAATARRREAAAARSARARADAAHATLAQRRRSRRAQADVLKDIGGRGGRGLLRARGA